LQCNWLDATWSQAGKFLFGVKTGSEKGDEGAVGGVGSRHKTTERRISHKTKEKREERTGLINEEEGSFWRKTPYRKKVRPGS